MKLPELQRPQIIQEIKMINEDLERRISEIEAHPDSALQSASQTYRKYISSLNIDLKSDMKDVEWRDITHIYRNLRYISELKSSTLEGAQKAYKTWTPLYNKMQNLYAKDEKLGQEYMRKVQEIINKVYEISDVYRSYYYEVRDAAIEMTVRGIDTDTAVNMIDRIYKKTLSTVDRRTTTKNLKEIYHKNMIDAIERNF